MRSSVVRPIAVYTLAWCGGFSRRLCPFHGPATPDFEAALVCYIGPLPTWHVERSRKSPKWLVAFVAAISCLVRIDDIAIYEDRNLEIELWIWMTKLNDWQRAISLFIYSRTQLHVYSYGCVLWWRMDRSFSTGILFLSISTFTDS